MPAMFRLVFRIRVDVLNFLVKRPWVQNVSSLQNLEVIYTVLGEDTYRLCLHPILTHVQCIYIHKICIKCITLYLHAICIYIYVVMKFLINRKKKNKSYLHVFYYQLVYLETQHLISLI